MRGMNMFASFICIMLIFGDVATNASFGTFLLHSALLIINLALSMR